VRQGDPRSPLLFVLHADLLQSVINRAKDNGILKLAIQAGYINDFLIVQYADDNGGLSATIICSESYIEHFCLFNWPQS
jgi:hypothetical protein